MTVAARQANTLILRIGNGPQFMALGGGRSDVTPSINHFCLTVNKFDHAALVEILGQHGVEPAEQSGMSGGPLRVRIRQRGADFGGAPEGTPELYIGDPDGVVVQLQDTTYCGGEGVLGERCPSPEPSSRRGLIAVRDINHFTAIASDQQRGIKSCLACRVFVLRVRCLYFLLDLVGSFLRSPRRQGRRGFTMRVLRCRIFNTKKFYRRLSPTVYNEERLSRASLDRWNVM